MFSSDRPALIAHVALITLQLATLVIHVPTTFNIIASASLCVYAGSWRSIKAEEPNAKDVMTKTDAMRFPLIGSCTLFGLFVLFKICPKELVNALLSIYIGGIAVFVITAVVEPYVKSAFPASLASYKLTLPLFRIPYILEEDEPFSATGPELVIGLLSSLFCFSYFLSGKHYLANNLIGIAFSLQGIEMLSLGSTQTGAILLSGLFFYDIFWVFCTPVMVSVAKNFDAPIKLLFPRLGDLVNGKRPMSMLGLGDIVIPGIFVALILRYDVQKGFRSQYFRTCFIGYVLGLGLTIFIMGWFKAAQPALLYIVPSVLGCTGLHAYLKGEFQELWTFNETPAAEAKEGEKIEAKKDK